MQSNNPLYGTSSLTSGQDRTNTTSPKMFRSGSDDRCTINDVPTFALPVTPVVPQSNPVRNYKRFSMRYTKEETTPQKSADLLLKEMSYEPVSSITVKDDKNNTIGSFIEAINPLGSNVMIEVEDLTPSSSSLSNKEVIASDVGVDDVLKQQSLALLQPEVKGVAIQCGNGICTLVGDGVRMTERSGTVVKGAISSGMLTEDTLTTTPIISLKEIVADKTAAINNVDIAVTRVVNETFGTCSSILDDFNDKYRKLRRELAQFYLIVTEKLADIGIETQELRLKLKAMAEVPPVTDIDKKRHLDMMKRASYLESMHFEILRWCKVLEGQGLVVEEMTNIVHKLNDYTKMSH